MSDALSRARLPLLVFSLLLLVGGSKLDAVRPLEGQVVALAIPLLAVVSGVGPYRESDASLRNVVFALGALVFVLAEIGSYRVVFDDVVASPAVPVLVLLGLALVLAVTFEVAGAQRGLRSRLSAWLGLAIVFALYFPGHAAPQNLFGSVFAAFMVALFVGGGTGLFLGEFAVRRARR
ncbi:MAG: hypothetical protein ABIQ16_18400 [Polyangiaceae bacterium]